MNFTTLINWQRRVIPRPEFNFYRGLSRAYPKSRLYLVGGVVRDLLLGRPAKDIDFVVTGVPESKLAVFLKRYGREDLVGRTFGVIKFIPKGFKGAEAFDIAIPRLDKPRGQSGAYRDVKVIRRSTLPIEDDLSRRDFTINALAWNISEKKLISAPYGLADLQARRLRTVGDPETRFREDFSRMLRGLRFAAELKFTIEPKTWRALNSLIRHLNDERRGIAVVPREVIAKELLKAFWADPTLALSLYDRSGALNVLIPEIEKTKTCPQPKPFHMEGSVWRHTVLSLKLLYSRQFRRFFPERPDAELIMTVLFHDIGKPFTLKTPKRDKVDRIRFDGHDVAGGVMAKKIAERLKLASLPTDGPLSVKPEHLDWLIKHHLLLLHDNVRRMKLTTIEKYFVRHPLATKLQQLIFVDSLATIPKNGRPVLRHMYDLRRVLKKMQGRSRHMPKPILNGDAIMKTLSIASGPLVGLLSRQLREQQLLGIVKNKKQAIVFIKRAYDDAAV